VRILSLRFKLSDSIWVGDLGLKQKIDFFFHFGPVFDGFWFFTAS
jgi:hypothetical protein